MIESKRIKANLIVLTSSMLEDHGEPKLSGSAESTVQRLTQSAKGSQFRAQTLLMRDYTLSVTQHTETRRISTVCTHQATLRMELLNIPFVFCLHIQHSFTMRSSFKTR